MLTLAAVCLPREASAEGVAPADDHALQNFLEAYFLAGQRKEFLHHGVEMNGFGNVRVQLQGTRVVVMALISEIKDYIIAMTPDPEEEVCTIVFWTDFFATPWQRIWTGSQLNSSTAALHNVQCHNC